MNIQLSEPQADFAFSPAAHPALFGGFGAGKSQAGTIRLVHLITQNPGIDVSHFFPSYRLAKRRGFGGTSKYLKSIDIAYTLNKSELTIFLPEFGSTMYFESYHDPEAMVSFEVAHSVVDELDTLKKEAAQLVWQKATERTRQRCTHEGGNTVACVSTPDQGTAGYCFELWGAGERLSDGYHYIRAGTRTNRFLPEGYADQIAKNYDPIMAEAFLDGGWVSFTRNKVYHFFNRTEHATDRILTPLDTIVYIGLDFNIGGCCAVAFILDKDNPVAVDEFTSHDTRDFINNLARYAGKTVIVCPDVASGFARHTNAAQTDIAMISQAGYQIDADSTNPAIRDRVNAFNAMLAHDRLKVNLLKCPNLANALETQGYDKNGDPEKWEKHPAIDDWCDSAGYFISRKFPIIRPLTQHRIGGI